MTGEAELGDASSESSSKARSRAAEICTNAPEKEVERMSSGMAAFRRQADRRHSGTRRGPLMGSFGRLGAQEGRDLLPESLVDGLAEASKDAERQMGIVDAGRADLVQHAALVPMDSRPGLPSN